jgi:hypothetical protein
MKRQLSLGVLLVSAAAAAVGASLSGCGGESAAPGDAGPVCMPIDPPASCPSPPPSYKKEIAFVVANDCAGANCHAAGGAESVHDFTTYEGVFADPLGYPQPTATQRADLVAWASVCGAPDN